MNAFSVASLDPLLKNTETWPQVDEQSIVGVNKRKLFINRGKAVRLMLDQAGNAQIMAETGLPRREALRLLKRCLAVSPDGRMYGFRALIPNEHIVSYKRHAKVKIAPQRASSGVAGIFQQLLRAYPALADLIEDQVFKLSKRRHVYESRIPLKSLHKHFIDKCREVGLETPCQYPFNTQSLLLICRLPAMYAHFFSLIPKNLQQARSARTPPKGCAAAMERHDP